MPFFRYFPSTRYTFTDPTGRETSLDMVNLTAHVKIAERLRKHITVFYDYVVEDGERPDSVAMKLYGNVDYTWIVLFLNQIFTLFDWVLTNEEFAAYVVERYGSIAAAQAQVIYRTVDNYRVDALTWATLDGSARGVSTTAYDVEFAENEAKRKIRVVPREFVGSLVSELRKALA